MGQGCSAEKLQQIIKEVDVNGNGVIEWPEFLQIMANIYSGKYSASTSAKTVTSPEPSRTTGTASSFKNANTPVASSTPAKTNTTTTSTSTGSPAPKPTTTTTNTVSPAPKTTTTTNTGSPAPKPTTTTNTVSPAPKTTTTTNTGTPAPKPATTTATSPSTSAANTANKPATQSTGFQASKPATNPSSAPSQQSTAPKSPGVGIGNRGSMNTNPKCIECGKTVYTTEAVTTNDMTWHKGCFRCSEAGCGIVLSLKTFIRSGEKVFCDKHVPKYKANVGVDTMAMASVKAAPKLKGVSGIKKDARTTFAPGKLQPLNLSEDQQQEDG